jgi:PTS system mannose-specific IIC component
VSEVAQLLPLSVLGAVLGLDVVSFPQAMVSRPIVAATLAGALVGEAGRGLVAGIVLELFALETLPFGASRYPEWGSASVVGGALFATQAPGTGGALAVSACAALATAAVGGWSMVLLRRLIGRWARARGPALRAGSWSAVADLQLRGMTSDLVRGGALTMLALLVLHPISQVVLSAWTLDPALSRPVVLALAGAVSAAAVWNVTHTTRGASWLLAGGLVVGLALSMAT